MSSPHLILPFTPAQLGLVAGDETTTVLAVTSGRFAGPTVLVHLPTALARLDWLSPEVEVIVFIDEPQPDPPTIGTVDDMLSVFPHIDTEALIHWVPSTEALKLESDGVIASGVDRSLVVSVRCPEVLSRQALEGALRSAGSETWVNPTNEVARAGGRVRLFEPGILSGRSTGI